MHEFQLIEIEEFENHPIRHTVPEETIFQTPEWLRFLQATQGGKPVTVLVKKANATIGYFTGMLISKLAIHILGGPFPGWSTGYMGFALLQDVCHSSVLAEFVPWAFDNLHCVHIEMMDRHIHESEAPALGLQFRREQGYEIDLTRSEDELFHRMTHQRRSNVRKAIRSHVIVEDAHDLGFADDYYYQLREVFGKRHLPVPFPHSRVVELVRLFGNSPNCLFLRARDSQGQCIATAIMLGGGGLAYLWGAASLHKYQILRPNDLLYWTVMKRAKELRMQTLDMGGAGTYKAKYGGAPICVPWFRVSRFPIVSTLRNVSERVIEIRRRSVHLL